MTQLLDTGSSGSGWSYYSPVLLCEQKFVFDQAERAGEVDQENVALPLRKGSVLHAGQAHHYALKLGWDVYDPIVAMKMVGDSLKLTTSLLADMIAIHKAYVQKYAYEAWRVVDVEKLVRGNIDGVPYSMRLDLVIDDERGRRRIVDHKSSSKVSPEIGTRYTLSGQFIAALKFGKQLYGDSFSGITINAITSRADDFRFIRVPLPPTPGTTWEHFKDMIKDAHKRIQELKAGRQPRRVMHENICVTQYGVCPYFSRCQGMR